MATEKNLNNLIINKVENQTVYDYMKTNNLINADELYFISGADDNATETESGLMSAEDKIKLDGIEEGANKTIIDAALSSTSTNTVQNKVINIKFNSVQSDIDSRVPSSRTVNGKALTDNITLSASDVGALPSSTVIPSIDGLATETYVNNKVAGLVDSAPSTLDTLNELAAALGDDPNFATTVATQIGEKVDKVDGKGLSTNDFTTAEKSKLASVEKGANNYTHPSYTAITGVPTANQTPAFGETFKVSQPISDATGHITAIKNRVITIPDTVATTNASGLMSAADKTKLDRLPIQNLIKYPYYSKNVYSQNGLIFRVGEDGSVTVNGTATATTFFNFSYRKGDTAITLTPGQNYYLSGCPSGGGAGKYGILINYTSDSGSAPDLARDSGNGVLFTATQSALNNLYGCYIIISSGQVCSDLVFRPMLTMGEILYNYTSPITSTAINTIDNIPPGKNGNMSYSDILFNASLKDSILTYNNSSKNWRVIKFFDDYIILTKNYSVDITKDTTFGTIACSQKITLNLMEPFDSSVTIVGTADTYGASITNTNLSNNGVSITYRVLVPSNTFPSKVYVRLAIIGSKRAMPTSLSRSNTASNQAKAVNIAKSYYDVAVAKKEQGIQEFGYGTNWSYHSSKVLRNENGCGMLECDTFVLMVALGIPYDKSPYNSDWNTNIYKGIYPKTSSPFNIALNEANANFDQADLIVNPDGNYWSFNWMKQHVSDGTTIFDNAYGSSAISDTGEMAWDLWRRRWVFSDINSSESGDIVLFRSKSNIGKDYIGFDLIVHVGIISIENNERWVYHVSGLSETDGLIVGKIRLNDIIQGRGYTSENYYFARPDYSLNEGV